MRAPDPILPVENCLSGLLQALDRRGTAVLQAPPGAGKSTRVPLAVLESATRGWLSGQRILMLEPRRLAARSSARRMAWLLDEPLGHTVGLATRHERLTGPDTRVEVITEGILTRRLQRDPSLEGTGLVIFDEFHERSLQADLGLALCLHARALLRPDLRILVMSATLDAAATGRLMGDAPVITGAGRAHPVRIDHRPPSPAPGDVAGTAVNTVCEALASESGSILVFLPGRREIEQAARGLASRVDADTRVCPLYGQLPPQDQDAAILPAPAGTRKVVLATDIAETSLTIEGIRVVVDPGLARRPVFDPRTGLTRLDTVRISRASAEQRCGRAGRLGPGTCIRLWSAETHGRLPAHTRAEILEADLAPLALTLACWGAGADELRWLDPPPAAALDQAHDLLRSLGALDSRGSVTDHGRALEDLGTHPRLGHMLLESRERSLGRTACLLTALLEERDPLPADAGCDLRLRLRLLCGTRAATAGIRRGVLERIRNLAERRVRLLGVDRAEPVEPDAAGVLLGLAYPDRIARRRPGGAGRFLLSSGRGARLPEGGELATHDWIVAAVVDGGDRDAWIRLAAPLAREEVEDQLRELISERDVLEWDEAEQAARVCRERHLGALVLEVRPPVSVDPQAITTLLAQAIRSRGLQILPWDRESLLLRQRMAFARALEPEGGWPDVSDTALSAGLEHWLAPYLGGMNRLAHLNRLKLADTLSGLLDWQQRRRLDRLAPTHVALPTGSRLRVDYSDPEAPVLAARVQQLFGLTQTPKIGDGRVPLILHLLSPAGRPVQVTRDLAGFWARTYTEIRKDLKGRYPKHHWPEDPLSGSGR